MKDLSLRFLGPIRATTLFALSLLTLFAGVPLHSDELDSDETPGFGLQASIFNQVKNSTTDINRDYSSMTDYPLTPGDIFQLTLSSGVLSSSQSNNISTSYHIQLDEDYILSLPIIGDIDVRGLSIPEIRKYVKTEMRERGRVGFTELILRSPAQFNVFVYGGVNSPGYIAASPMTDVLSGIALSGGFKPDASYRNVVLIRGEEGISLDISRYYNEADTSVNPRLQPGDKIYVPPAQIISTVSGKIGYPGKYEMLNGESLADLLLSAGSISVDADPQKIEVLRNDIQGSKRIIQVSLEDAAEFPLENGDAVTVRSLSENSEMVSIEGAIFGTRLSGTGPVLVPRETQRVDIPYYQGISVLSVLDSVGGPTPFSERVDGFIRHKDGGNTPLAYQDLWETRDLALDITLSPGDVVVIPLKILKVFVTGQVSKPGAFPFQTGLTVRDYILLAGGINLDVASDQDIYFVDEEGKRAKVALDTIVPEDTVIHVTRNLLYTSDKYVKDALIWASWITAVTAAITAVINLSALVSTYV